MDYMRVYYYAYDVQLANDIIILRTSRFKMCSHSGTKKKKNVYINVYIK